MTVIRLAGPGAEGVDLFRGLRAADDAATRAIEAYKRGSLTLLEVQKFLGHLGVETPDLPKSSVKTGIVASACGMCHNLLGLHAPASIKPTQRHLSRTV